MKKINISITAQTIPEGFSADLSIVIDVLRASSKFVTALQYGTPEIIPAASETSYGVIYFGTSEASSREALDYLAEEGVSIDAMRVRSFPFNDEVESFIDSHERTFVIEQNRDSQMKILLAGECGVSPGKLVPVTNFNGLPITATMIINQIHTALLARGKMNLTTSTQREAIS